MPYNRSINILAVGVVFVGLAAAFAVAAPLDADHDGIPDQAEALLGTDPKIADTDGDGQNDKIDWQPTSLENPIEQTGSPATIHIVSAKVEDNFDPATKMDVSDHLEIEIANVGKTNLTGVMLYLTLTDDTNAKTESLYRELTGFTVAAGKTSVLHFDLEGSADWTAVQTHFRANENSMLYTSSSAKTLQLQLSAAGQVPVALTFKKDAGGAEVAD